MKFNQILNKLAKKFPKRYAKLWHDYVGHMVGDKPEEIHKVLLCLDADWELLPYVDEYKPDIVISHHPFIFGTKAKVLKYDESKRLLVEEFNKRRIPIYSYHTNFDTGKDGMNDALANLLDLQDVYAPEKHIMMRIGNLKKEMPVEEFAKYAVKKFKVDYSLLISKGKPTIKKVGIIGGGGSRDWVIAKEEGCDIYISGDAPHYVRRDITNAKYNYLDMPHEIEHVFMPQMKKLLLEIDPTLEIVEIDHEKLPKVIC